MERDANMSNDDSSISRVTDYKSNFEIKLSLSKSSEPCIQIIPTFATNNDADDSDNQCITTTLQLMQKLSTSSDTKEDEKVTTTGERSHSNKQNVVKFHAFHECEFPLLYYKFSEAWTVQDLNENDGMIRSILEYFCKESTDEHSTSQFTNLCSNKCTGPFYQTEIVNKKRDINEKCHQTNCTTEPDLNLKWTKIIQCTKCSSMNVREILVRCSDKADQAEVLCTSLNGPKLIKRKNSTEKLTLRKTAKRRFVYGISGDYVVDGKLEDSDNSDSDSAEDSTTTVVTVRVDAASDLIERYIEPKPKIMKTDFKFDLPALPSFPPFTGFSLTPENPVSITCSKSSCSLLKVESQIFDFDVGTNTSYIANCEPPTRSCSPESVQFTFYPFNVNQNENRMFPSNTVDSGSGSTNEGCLSVQASSNSSMIISDELLNSKMEGTVPNEGAEEHVEQIITDGSENENNEWTSIACQSEVTVSVSMSEESKLQVIDDENQNQGQIQNPQVQDFIIEDLSSNELKVSTSECECYDFNKTENEIQVAVQNEVPSQVHAQSSVENSKKAEFIADVDSSVDPTAFPPFHSQITFPAIPVVLLQAPQTSSFSSFVHLNQSGAAIVPAMAPTFLQYSGNSGIGESNNNSFWIANSSFPIPSQPQSPEPIQKTEKSSSSNSSTRHIRKGRRRLHKK